MRRSASSVSPVVREQPVLLTLATLEFRRTVSGASRAAIDSGIACMPQSGTATSPSANILKTNSNMRLDVSSCESRNTPPRNGRKNPEIIDSENPVARSRSSVVVSWAANSCSISCDRSLQRNRATLSLSIGPPMGARNDSRARAGCRQGSARRWNRPCFRITAPGKNRRRFSER